jgi:hypothetical protein
MTRAHTPGRDATRWGRDADTERVKHNKHKTQGGKKGRIVCLSLYLRPSPSHQDEERDATRWGRDADTERDKPQKEERDATK